MATIEQRRAKAARARLDKGKKPFTDTKPAPKKKRAPSKGLPKRGKIPIRMGTGSTTFDLRSGEAVQRIIREITGRSRKKVKKAQEKVDSFDKPVTSL